MPYSGQGGHEEWSDRQPVEVGDILRQGPSRQPMRPGDEVILKSPAGQKVTLVMLPDGSMRVKSVSSGGCSGVLLAIGAGMLGLVGAVVRMVT